MYTLDKSSTQGLTFFCVRLFCTFVFLYAENAKFVEKEILLPRRERPLVYLLEIQRIRRKSRSSQLVLMESQSTKNSKNLGLF